MMVEDLREKTRELQMFHVTRDLQAVFNEGEERGQANESANLEALSRQRETLHKKVGGDEWGAVMVLLGSHQGHGADRQRQTLHKKVGRGGGGHKKVGGGGWGAEKGAGKCSSEGIVRKPPG